MVAFAQSLPMILHRTLDSIMPAYRALFARYDLTEQQWRVLRSIWTSDRVTSAELSRQTLLPAPSLVGIVDRLEKKSLVSRVRAVSDRRVVYVVATPEGRKLQKEVIPRVNEIHEQIFDTVSAEEWQAMEKTLEKISQQRQATSGLDDPADTKASRPANGMALQETNHG